jgi:DNA invertase Pin-like site-specific DNA recombinase
MLEDLARGEHTLLIERLDQEGRALADAQRTFYVLRTALGRTP